MRDNSPSLTAIEALASPNTILTDIVDIKVSKRSRIFDTEWDFTADLMHRPRSVSDSHLRIRWEKWPFSLLLRQELQRIFGLFNKAPRAFSGRGPLKPNSFCGLVNVTLPFLSDVILRHPAPDLIVSVAQIEWTDLKAAAATYSRSMYWVRRGLKILFHPAAEKALGKRFQVGPQDIKRLVFKPPEYPKEENLEGPAMMPDALFALLSDESSARVKDFLQRLGLRVEDHGTYKYHAPHAIQQIQDFPDVFALYEQWRRLAKGIEDSNVCGSTMRNRLRALGIPPGTLNAYLIDVSIAAQCSLGLYMGARFSELTSLEVGCLTERDRVPCIIGRNFKGRKDSDLSDDAWVAIPIMRDAVRALEAVARLKNNTFLCSSFETAGGKTRGKAVRNKGIAFSSGGFTDAVQNFIRSVDKSGRFHDWQFNTHQFKHSLARQLIKAKLGLPYISFHLKHLHSRVATLPSDVTLGYGNVGKTLQSEQAGLQMHEMRRELAIKLFDPDSPVHGGAAAEFDERRKAYFKGMTDAGMSKEQIIDELVKTTGSTFVNVGLGFCTGRKDDPETREKPPCIGSLRCNPSQCSNAIVTREAHGPAWKKVYLDNLRMACDPRFAYGWPQFEAAAHEAREVLRWLGEDVEDESPA